MAQSPQVIQTDSGSRNLQALLAGGQAFGQGLSQLGQAIASMRERQKQRREEGEAEELVKKYGAFASTPKAIGEMSGPMMPTEQDRSNFLMRLLAEGEGSIRARAMAGQIIEQYDPAVGGKLAIQNAIAERQSSRMEEERTKFSQQQSLREASLAQREEELAALMKRHADTLRLSGERLDINKTKLAESQQTQRESITATKRINELLQIPADARIGELLRIFTELPTSELKEGNPLLDGEARKLLTGAIEKTNQELIDKNVQIASTVISDRSTEAALADIMRDMETPGIPVHESIALGKVAADLRAKLTKDETGYSQLVEAMTMAMKNSGSPVSFSGDQGFEEQAYLWLIQDPAFLASLTAHTTTKDAGSKGRLSSGISARLAAPAMAEQQQMFALLGTSPAKPISAMFEGSENPQAKLKFIEKMVEIHRRVMADAKKKQGGQK